MIVTVMAATEVMTAMAMADMVATAMGIAMEMDTAGVTDVALMSILLLPMFIPLLTALPTAQFTALPQLLSTALLLPMLIPLPTAPFIALPTALPQLLSTALHLPLPTGMLLLLTPMPTIH